jgi:hypothetical protein
MLWHRKGTFKAFFSGKQGLFSYASTCCVFEQVLLLLLLWCHDTHHNDTMHNDTQHNDTYLNGDQ